PAIVSDGSQLNVVVIGTEGNLYYATLSFAGTWSTCTSLTGATPVTPTLVIDSANTLHLVVQGHDNAVYEKAHPSGGSWSATWTSGGGITKGSPAVAVLGTTLNVVATGADARLWYNTFSGTTFSGWVFMNGAASTSPGVSTPDQINESAPLQSLSYTVLLLKEARSHSRTGRRSRGLRGRPDE